MAMKRLMLLESNYPTYNLTTKFVFLFTPGVKIYGVNKNTHPKKLNK